MRSQSQNLTRTLTRTSFLTHAYNQQVTDYRVNENDYHCLDDQETDNDSNLLCVAGIY